MKIIIRKKIIEINIKITSNFYNETRVDFHIDL